KVLKAQAYASCWLDLVSPWFTHTVSPNGYDIYTVNQDGILPVYPPKASDDRNHYEFDHWATDALLTGTDRPLDLETIDEWFDYYSPNYKCAVFYPVYKAVEHTFVEHTDTPATCETDGTGRYVCADCGFEGESYAIPATAHRNAYEVAATEATAAVHGHTAGVYCPDCAAWLSGHEVIHNTLGERTYLDEYTEEGYQKVVIVCTVCGESGLYALEPVSPTEPTDPNGGDGPLSPFSKAIQSIVSFILRLIKWLSDLA
ncbi:MAG: hypothetical protein K6G71_09145, partial [Clostridiales bacterium]|nr:hypothetical protein [Clostridiales bacterium]